MGRPLFVFRHTAGRPTRDARLRLDAIFWLAAQPNGPRQDCQSRWKELYKLPDRAARWFDLPAHVGKPDRSGQCPEPRQFRRWAHAALWPRLLLAIADPSQPGHAVLRGLESWICRAYRRAWRIPSLPGIFLARRLGLLSALRAPPDLLADPDLSEDVQTLSVQYRDHIHQGRLHAIPSGFFGRCARLFRIAGGRTRIPWYLAPA